VTYAALVIFGLAVPFAAGAWAGARFGAGACVFICLVLVSLLIGAPLLLLEIMPRNTSPQLEELFASVALISFLGSSVLVGEYTAGVFYGRKSRKPTYLTKGIED
jgi:hypothetical protein